MSQTTSATTDSTVAMPEISWEDNPEAYAANVHAKYEEEKLKRLRPEGNEQFVRLYESEKYKHFGDDPWLPIDGSVPGYQLQHGKVLHFKFAITGAGFGGLLYAAHLVKAGYKADDIVLVDYAGGFGGTWYWNRYPGLMCDTESYCYVPLLEETDYMPKHKYSYGEELREHAQRIASAYGVSKQAIFRSTVKSMDWEEGQKLWRVNIVQLQGSNAQQVQGEITADFVMSTSGTLNFPKLPRLPGMDNFKGHQFHTSRFDYSYTGGSQDNPELVNLKDKRVAIVGTGATAVQLVPHLAKWAKELVVVQRTPSSVDVRGQKVTDSEWYAAKCANKPGWQTERNANLAASLSTDRPNDVIDLIDDGASHMLSYHGLIGRAVDVQPTAEAIGSHIADLYAKDFPRAERIRKRVDQVVNDKSTAQQLKAWYPAWCKRPCFHDDYLPTFNKDNVTLADTAGKGIDSLTEDGIVIKGKTYEVDLLIWSTGFALLGEPSAHPLMKIRGRSGKTLAEHWSPGMASLHGVVTSDFPNFFYPGPLQSGITFNIVFLEDTCAKHTAYIISQAERQNAGQKVTIEPKSEAEEAWAMRVAGTSTNLAGMSNCTPGYLNAEGMMTQLANAPQEEQMKAARMSIWGRGLLDYQSVISDWRSNGGLNDLTISVVS